MYFVAYDLKDPGQNYDGLISKIKSYGRWCHLQYSVWIVQTEASADAIWDHLRKSLDGNDKLIIARLEGEAAWSGYGQAVSNWIKESA